MNTRLLGTWRICTVSFFIIICHICFYANAQSILNNYKEKIVDDIKSLRFDDVKPKLEYVIEAFEKGDLPFNDIDYIGSTTLLSSIYARENRLYVADSIIDNALVYLDVHKVVTPSIFSLYYAKGMMQSNIDNYSEGRKWIAKAVGILKEQAEGSDLFVQCLASLASCNLKIGDTSRAKEDIENCLSFIENIRNGNEYSPSTIVQVYHIAGAISYQSGNVQKATKYILSAYDLSDGNDALLWENINCGMDLATYYVNDKQYSRAINIYQKLEALPLRDEELLNIYNGLFITYYYLNDETNCIEYAQKHSNLLKYRILALQDSFATIFADNSLFHGIKQLDLNNSIIKKFFSSPKATEMCYDNLLFNDVAEYYKNERIREEIKGNNSSYNLISEIFQVRTEIFNGNLDSSMVFEKYKYISNLENKFLHSSSWTSAKKTTNYKTWKDVAYSLKADEAAIEIFFYSGFPQDTSEQMEGRYGALLVTNDSKAPTFIDLCNSDSLHNVIFNSYIFEEEHTNELYNESNMTLYNLVWQNIDKYLDGKNTIYLSPIIQMNSLNIGCIPKPNGTRIKDNLKIKIVTSTSNICYKETNTHTSVNNAVLYGGINYSTECSNNSSYRNVLTEICQDTSRNAFNYLRGTLLEVQNVASNLRENKVNAKLFTGQDATEISFRALNGCSPTILHIATHGYYLVGFQNRMTSYLSKFIPLSSQNESLLYSGLLFANAHSTVSDNRNQNSINDGLLTAEEISFMDLSNTKLVVLSACYSAKGISSETGRYGGLIKAFKSAGVQHIMACQWKASDKVTVELMNLFYRYIISGYDVHDALSEAQKEISKSYPDPYYWAGFILLD